MKPTPSTERLDVLDVLRGFALIGILLANLVSFFGYYYLSFSEIQALHWLDRSVLFAIDWFIEGKFYALFSMLLGVGFYIQYQRSNNAETSFSLFWRRRMGFLLLLGLLHMHFIWYGDILTLYAILGFSLPLFLGVSNRRLMSIILLLLTLPLMIHALVVFTADAHFWTLLARFAKYIKGELGFAGRSDLVMLTSSSAHEVWSANVLGALQRPMSYLRSGRIPQVLGLFLLGFFLARYWLPRLRDGNAVPRRLWMTSALIGLLCSFVYAWIKAITGTAFSANAAGLFQGLVYHIGCTALMLGFAGALMWLWQHGIAHVFLRQLALIGRMPLTNYLSQNAIGIFLFYGYGFAWLGRLPFALIPIVAAGILVMQWCFCRYWFRYQPQGPVETLWRKFTYK